MTTAIDTAKTLIDAKITSGDSGHITATKLNSVLNTFASAVVTDRTSALTPYTPASPLTESDVQAAMDEVAGILDLKAPIESPALTGTPTAPTADPAVTSTQIATTAFVHAAVDALIAAAPGALNDLNELAAALGDDPNYASTVTTALAGKLALAGGTMTGDLTLDGDPDSALKAATKQYVDAVAGATANLGKVTTELAPHINLTVKNDATNSNYQLDVAADKLVLFDGASGTKIYSSFSDTVDISVSGAGGLDTSSEASSTFYYIHVIAKEDDTKSVLLSLSDTAPTMPTDYIYSGLVGAIYNDASSNFISISQINNRVARSEETLVSAGTATTWTSLSPTIPENARCVWGHMNGDHNTVNGRYLRVAPDSAGLGQQEVGGNQSGSNYKRAAPFNIPVITSQTIYYQVSSATSFSGSVYLNGWEF